MSQHANNGGSNNQAVFSQIGDGNSLRNHIAVSSMRDISSYDVKKVKFASDKENVEPESAGDDQVLVVDSKTKKAALKNKKQDDFKTKKDSIINLLDLNNTKSDSQKVSKQLAMQRKHAKQAQAKKFKSISWKQVLEEKEK